MEDAIAITNAIASEHLEIVTKNPFEVMMKIENAGAIFLGEYSSEPLGDYFAGPNHVLPTNRASRYTGGLSVFDFIKILTYQEIDADYAKVLSKTASYIANAEGLSAHKLASDLRG